MRHNGFRTTLKIKCAKGFACSLSEWPERDRSFCSEIIGFDADRDPRKDRLSSALRLVQRGGYGTHRSGVSTNDARDFRCAHSSLDFLTPRNSQAALRTRVEAPCGPHASGRSARPSGASTTGQTGRPCRHTGSTTQSELPRSPPRPPMRASMLGERCTRDAAQAPNRASAPAQPESGLGASRDGGRGRYRTADRWCVKPELYH